MASRIQIGALYGVDTESTFASTSESHAGALGSANNYLKIAEGTADFDPVREALRDLNMQDNLARTKPIPGAKRDTSLKFGMRAAAEGVTTPTTNFVLGKLIQSNGATWATDTQASATLTGGGAPDDATYTVLDADAPTIGHMVVIKDVTDGNKEIRWVKDTSSGGGTTTVTLNQALSFTPASSDVQYVGHTFSPDDSVASGESLYMRMTKEGTNQAWNLYGGRQFSPITVSLQDGFPVMQFDFAFADYARADGLSLPGQTWQWGSAIPYVNAPFYLDGTKVAIRPDWELVFGNQLDRHPTGDGQGVAEYEVASRVNTLKVSRQFNSTWWDYLANETSVELMLNVGEGTSAGNEHLGIFLPAAHAANVPSEVAEGQQSYIEALFEAGDYTADGSSTAPGDTDIRIGLVTSA